MLKTIFLLVIFVYVIIVVIWCCSFPISYKMTNGTYHKLKVDHNFTQGEIDGEEKAYRIRLAISNILTFSSVMFSVGSYVLLRNHLFEPAGLVKAVMIVSGVIAIILILVNGIHFIPGPPIR